MHEALDLCLACKGCKGECPVNVDMATYKAEFLSHYYAGRLRPRSAYAMGLIHWWARLAALAPALANALTHTPGSARLAKSGCWRLARARTMPAFAPQTFKHGGVGVPHASATVGARRACCSGPIHSTTTSIPRPPSRRSRCWRRPAFASIVPRGSLCCGRPLYDFGMLDAAKRLLRQILDALAPELAAGTPIVVLEPSCASVFRDELVNLFPDDENAHRLKAQTYLLSEFLEHFAPTSRHTCYSASAIVHGHCHHKALMGMRAEEAILRKHVANCETLDAGCCGMAGAFGFEANTTTSPSPVASVRCCRRCARPRRRR